MSRVLIFGDTHGQSGFWEIKRFIEQENKAAELLHIEEPVAAAIQLGDATGGFVKSFWVKDLDFGFPCPVHVISGNHEQWDVWQEAMSRKPSIEATTEKNGIIMHWDYSKFEIDEVVFGVIGRITDSRKIRDLQAKGLFLGEGPNKYHAELGGHELRQKLNNIDILLTHDAPFPFVFGRSPNPEDTRNNPDYLTWMGERADIAGSDYLANVVKSLHPTPKLGFGGHMHLTCVRYIGDTLFYQLPPIDPIFRDRGYAILETKDLSVTFKFWRHED